MLFFFSGFFLLNACAPRAVVPPKWIYENDAIHLTLQADPRLNWYNDEAHTLQLCVYQLKDPNAFNQYAQSEDGLSTLAACSIFDSSVANYQSFILAPAKYQTQVLDRAEGAKYVGLAAGYAIMEQGYSITRLLDIPVVEVKEGGMFSRQRVAKPDILNTILRLGPHQLETRIGE